MVKWATIGFGVLAWIASALGFYLQLSTSNLSEALQGGIIVGWIAAGLIVVSFIFGREFGERKISKTPSGFTSVGVVQIFRRRDVDRMKPLSERIRIATSDIFFPD